MSAAVDENEDEDEVEDETKAVVLEKDEADPEVEGDIEAVELGCALCSSMLTCSARRQQPTICARARRSRRRTCSC